MVGGQPALDQRVDGQPGVPHRAHARLEVDLIGRYLERLLEGRQEAPGGLTLEFLSKNGFRAD